MMRQLWSRILRFNVFRYQFFVPIPRENTRLTLTCSFLFVVASFVCFVIPDLTLFFAAEPSVSFLRAPRVGPLLNMSEGLPNFTFEIANHPLPSEVTWQHAPSSRSEDMDGFFDDAFSRYVEVVVTYRKIYEGKRESTFFERIPMLVDCTHATHSTGNEYSCRYRCNRRLNLKGGFGESNFTFVEITVKACEGPRCASRDEQVKFWAPGVTARLLWPTQFPDWQQGKVIVGSRAAVYRQWLSPPIGLLPDEPAHTLRAELRYTHSEGASNCPRAVNPYCEQRLSWLEYRRSRETVYRNTNRLIYSLILRLDEDHVELPTATFLTAAGIVSDIGGGVTMLLFFHGFALGMLSSRRQDAYLQADSDEKDSDLDDKIPPSRFG